MIIQPRPPIYYMIMTSNPFPLDYRNRHYIYFFCQNSFGIVSQEFGELDYPGGFWVNIPFPETTRIQILGGNPIMVQCVDIPLIMSIVQVPRLVNDMYTVNRTTLSAFSTGLLNASAYSELAIDFTVYAINGGSSPTVSFLVSRLGTDGQLYQLEKAPPLTGPGTISYSVGAGLDGKSFAGSFQVDMVTSGNPASVQISGSIKAKQ